MVGNECEITTINEQGNSAILNKKGWFLLLIINQRMMLMVHVHINWP